MQEIIDAVTSSTIYIIIAAVGALSVLMVWIVLPIGLFKTRRRLAKLGKDLLYLKAQVEGVEEIEGPAKKEADLACFGQYNASSPKCAECPSVDSCKAMS